jgi:hypothetical protein
VNIREHRIEIAQGTANFSDFIIADENLLHDILDITDDEMNENMYTYHILEQLNIPSFNTK